MMKVLFPDWAGFTPEFAAAELPRLIEEAEKAVAAVEAAEPKTYEDFVWPLDDATRGLWRCWGMVAHMLGVMNSEAWRKVEEDWQPKIVAFSLRVSQSKRLYETAKSILNAGSLNSDLSINESVRRRSRRATRSSCGRSTMRRGGCGAAGEWSRTCSG